MAYSISTTGMDELLGKLKLAGEAAQSVAAASLYEGAGVVADAVSQAVRGIATEPFHYAAGGNQRMPSPEEKALLESAPKGVAKFSKNGVSVNTNVGLSNAGYGRLGSVTKPIPQIANAINSGTSFMSKQPFIRQASAKGRGKAMAAIKATIEEAFDKITK